MSVKETVKKLNYPVDKLKTCPKCGEKKLFPPPDEALNALSKETGKHICIDCAATEDDVPGEYW